MVKRYSLSQPKTRLLVNCQQLIRGLTPARLLLLSIFGAFLAQRTLSELQGHKKLSLAPIASIERECPSPQYEKLSQSDAPPKICLTTLTDEKDKALATRIVGWRNFDGLLQLTWENKLKYAEKHGYHLFDESDQLDKSRPPSWSKIRAVQRLLIEEKCTWVFWLDADTVIMNSDKRIEDFLPSDPEKDLLLSADDGGGYNAGVWLVHNTAWALQFLQEWWDMKSFVKPPGLAKSGDNDALKYKLKNLVDFDDRILAPPRCTFNSYAKFVNPADFDRLSATVEHQDWHMSEVYYHKNDFVAHVAGVDNKVETIKMLLEIAT
mmetsp:Transcript_19504/g.25147  ORF Transcript_19504/g.25147 Transcript_19504/m.25147 type:complete len:321 (+) Transcript_19504:106-1068(+)|eukprot:CAMPEP_0198149416 /NCGR_PEP_ID=MMETSP1443-20131203/46467_1 /TAXON_ID=186043 /ORGANISM="Entomoneis sp., Strain CCMP2396" /LENGTH=320 /DNA_ID=CAMNT_0043814441 /DNA_START=94 /DNA_END=1056 /DNA_ORIENTATION=-